MLTEMLNFSKKTFFRPDNKIYTVYSAHDSNIVRIIKSLFNEEFIEINLWISWKIMKFWILLFLLIHLLLFLNYIKMRLIQKKNYVQIYYNGKLIKEKLKNIKNEYNWEFPFEEFKKS